jgi:Zn-dependent M28 family amino/carboxypeptidase
LRNLVLALAAAALAAGPAVSAEPQFSADRFRAHVTFLADDLLEGREPGARGYDIAARYVAAQFAQMGLKPGGEDGGWYQQVPFVETRLSAPGATVTVNASGVAKTFEQGGEAIVRGVPLAGAIDVKAPVVFAGYGGADPVKGIDDYTGVDAKGRFVVLFRAVGRDLDSEIAAHHRAEQIRYAADHGAAGVIIIRTRAQARTPWRTSTDNSGRPVTNWVGKDGKLDDPGIPVVNLSEVAAEALFAGAPRTLSAIHDEMARGLRPQGFTLPATVEVKAQTEVRRYTSPEVIGLIPGTDPLLKSQYVVLMGHLDHLGIRPDRKPDGIYNGALDNGAGIATLLEVARALAAKPGRRSILIIANTAEEKGLLGAKYFAANPTVPIQSIVAGIDLDMPLITYDFTDVVAYGGPHSTLDRAIAKAAAGMRIKVSPDWQTDQAIFVRSDHYALVRAGIPAVMLSTGEANGGQAAWTLFRDKHYHQPSDDLAQPILWSAGAKFSELNYRVARQLADQRERPLWYQGDYFGEVYAPAAPKAKR